MRVEPDDLSFDAKCVLGAWFGMGGKTVVTLHLRDSEPTLRCRAALNELVENKVLSVEPFNQFGGEVYKPLVENAGEFMRWLWDAKDDERAKFPLMQPITGVRK
jgi:hypothetical protein